MSAIEPFVIDVPDAVLGDLHERLARTRYADELPGAGWDYGTDQAFLRSMIDYWLDGYEWRAREARMNVFPQFVTEIDGTRRRTSCTCSRPSPMQCRWS